VVNPAETCDPENPVQWITRVQVASNTTDDSALLAEVLPDLKARTGVDTLFTEGSYGSPENDVLLAKHQVSLIQTAIRGRPQDPHRFYLEDFQVQAKASGQPEQRICAKGESAKAQVSSSGKAWVAVFGQACACCAERGRCPVAARKRSGEGVLHFTSEALRRAERRRCSRQHREAGRNLRAAVESTVRSVKYAFADGKAPVRGCFRVARMVLGASAVVNVRRSHRFSQSRIRPAQGERKQEGGQRWRPGRMEQPTDSAVFSLLRGIRGLRWRFLVFQPLQRLTLKFGLFAEDSSYFTPDMGATTPIPNEPWMYALLRAT
jgi:hypothetical protein